MEASNESKRAKEGGLHGTAARNRPADSADAAEANEAARLALEVAVQQLGTNPARVEQAERERDRSVAWAERDRDWSREAVADFLEMMDDTEKRDFLVQAAAEGKDKAAERLLAAGVDPDAVGTGVLADIDLEGDTALVACAWNGHTSVLELLLDKDADVNKAGCQGTRPLNAAAVSGHVSCVKRLLQAGAAINAQNDYGDTALSRAAYEGDEDTVKMLLDAGADTTLTDDCGRTALQLAKAEGHSRIVALLQA